MTSISRSSDSNMLTLKDIYAIVGKGSLYEQRALEKPGFMLNTGRLQREKIKNHQASLNARSNTSTASKIKKKEITLIFF